MSKEIFGNNSSWEDTFSSGEYSLSQDLGDDGKPLVDFVNPNFTDITCEKEDEEGPSKKIVLETVARIRTEDGKERIEVVCKNIREACAKSCPFIAFAEARNIPVDFFSEDDSHNYPRQDNAGGPLRDGAKGRPFILKKQLEKITP